MKSTHKVKVTLLHSLARAQLLISFFWCVGAVIPQSLFFGPFLLLTEIARSFPSLLFPWLALSSLIIVLMRRTHERRFATFMFGLVVVTIAVQSAVLYPFFTNDRHRKHSQSDLTIAVANVEFGWHSYANLKRSFGNRSPDLLAVSEVTFDWINGAELSEYPYKFELPGGWAEGVSLYSKFPIESGVGIDVGRLFNTIGAKVRVRERIVHVLVLHAPPPQVDFDQVLRTRYFSGVSKYLKTVPAHEAVVIAGDLNTTPFSTGYQRFVSEHGLRNVAEGFGLPFTWIAKGASVFRSSIDHVLTRDVAATVDVQVLPSFGSDHLPLWVRLRL